jgi:hypothetical protein
MDWSGLGWGPGVGPYENGSEPWSSIKAGEFHYQLLKKDCFSEF